MIMLLESSSGKISKGPEFSSSVGYAIYGLYQFLYPCFYYIILYYTENYLYNADDFRRKFHSKILVAVVTALEFFRLINFLIVRNSRKAVYVLFTINLLSVCILLFGTFELVLFGEDAAAVPASALSED